MASRANRAVAPKGTPASGSRARIAYASVPGVADPGGAHKRPRPIAVVGSLVVHPATQAASGPGAGAAEDAGAPPADSDDDNPRYRTTSAATAGTSLVGRARIGPLNGGGSAANPALPISPAVTIVAVRSPAFRLESRYSTGEDGDPVGRVPR